MNVLLRYGALAGLVLGVFLGMAAHGWAAEEAAPDPFVVPEGGPEILLDYLAKLEKLRPTTRTMDAVRQFAKQQAEAFITVGDRLLAVQSNEKQFDAAISAKVSGLLMLGDIGDPQASQRLQTFLAEMIKTGHPEVAREINCYLLEQGVKEAQSDPPTLVRVGQKVVEFVKAAPREPLGINLAYQTVLALEQLRDARPARDIYQQLGDLIAKHDKPELAELGRKMQGAARRLGLLGKPLELEGETVTGAPLKWADYRGRVTVVIFWTISCPPCQRELQSLRDYYQQYHDRGFDVVGINLDGERQELASYLKEKVFPWTMLYDQARAENNTGEPMAVRYGILTFPHTLLVDRQGTVVALEPRGPEVGELLEKLIGPPTSKPTTKP